MTKAPHVSSQITFLYFDDLANADQFFQEIMDFRLVEDQGWAKIYQVADMAFIGAVDGNRGSCKAQEENALLVTLCVEDVAGWAKRLKEHGVTITKDVAVFEEINIINCFFTGPGNYKFELQEFLSPGAKAIFHAE